MEEGRKGRVWLVYVKCMKNTTPCNISLWLFAYIKVCLSIRLSIYLTPILTMLFTIQQPAFTLSHEHTHIYTHTSTHTIHEHINTHTYTHTHSEAVRSATPLPTWGGGTPHSPALPMGCMRDILLSRIPLRVRGGRARRGFLQPSVLAQIPLLRRRAEGPGR